MRPLLLVGNRRSGTTLFVETLNAHLNIYVSQELGSLWAIRSGQGELAHWTHFNPEFDRIDPGDVVASEPRERYFEEVHRAMREGIPGRQDAYPEKVETVVWMGDKAPEINCAPDSRDFLDLHFPDARYLHIVRHPVLAVSSMVGTFWKGTPAEVLEFWATVEEYALEMPALVVRYRDLCSDPAGEMARVCDHLDLDPALWSPHLKRGENMGIDYALETRRPLLDLELTDRVRHLMDIYGFDNDPFGTDHG